MTLHTTIAAAPPALRIVREIDALQRALANFRHWELAKATRAPFFADSDKAARLFCTAADKAEEAYDAVKDAAAVLFEIDVEMIP